MSDYTRQLELLAQIDNAAARVPSNPTQDWLGAESATIREAVRELRTLCGESSTSVNAQVYIVSMTYVGSTGIRTQISGVYGGDGARAAAQEHARRLSGASTLTWVDKFQVVRTPEEG